MNWIDDFLKECKKAETPDIWLRWCAIATISAVVSPNVYLSAEGLYEIKPNLFIMLIGRSGLGKNFGIKTSRKLVSMVGNTRVIAGRSTIEATIQALGSAKTSENGSIPFKDSRGYICTSEFASSIHRNNDALTILTDLYDNPEEWPNVTKTGGIDYLKSVCISMLTAANPDMFNLAVENTHIQGGFIGRTFLISAEVRSKISAHVQRDYVKFDYEKLVKWLCVLSKLKGEFQFTDDAIEFFEDWYNTFATKFEEDLDDKTGTVDRLKDHVKKVSMCMALAKRSELLIDVEDIEESLDLCGGLIKAATRLTAGQGSSKSSPFTKHVLEILMNSPNKTMTRRRMLQKGMGRYNSGEFDKTMDGLLESKLIEVTSVNRELAYQATDALSDWWGKVINVRKN